MSSDQGKTVGIDLGTTFSAIAYVTESGQVEVVANRDGHLLTPSIVFIDDDDVVLVGEDAQRASLLEPERSARCFKRDMGLEKYSGDLIKDFRPEVLSAYVLTKLKQDAEEKIGPIKDAVITVPAFFDETRRKATQDAANIAGLEVLAIINEPVSAALWHGFDESAPDGSTILIYDLGGGTFDTTLMQINGDKFETIATNGDVRLGGVDWNKRLFEHVVKEFVKITGEDPTDDPIVTGEINSRIEEAKRSLSKVNSVRIPISYNGRLEKIKVTRDEFELLTKDLVEQTKLTIELLMRETKQGWDSLSKVILVGGSSHMPMIQKMLSGLSKRDVEKDMNLEQTVVKGAAVYAASLNAKKATSVRKYAAEVNDKLQVITPLNVNSHSLGIEVESPQTGEPMNHIIIPRNSPIPCRSSDTFGLASAATAAGASIQINILEGESANPEACIQIGLCTIDGLPAGLGQGSPVEVTFSYSAEGRISVSAVAVEANCEANTHIESKHGLSSDDVEAQSKQILKLQIL